MSSSAARDLSCQQCGCSCARVCAWVRGGRGVEGRAMPGTPATASRNTMRRSHFCSFISGPYPAPTPGGAFTQPRLDEQRSRVSKNDSCIDGTDTRDMANLKYRTCVNECVFRCCRWQFSGNVLQSKYPKVVFKCAHFRKRQSGAIPPYHLSCRPL